MTTIKPPLTGTYYAAPIASDVWQAFYRRMEGMPATLIHSGTAKECHDLVEQRRAEQKAAIAEQGDE